MHANQAVLAKRGSAKITNLLVSEPQFTESAKWWARFTISIGTLRNEDDEQKE